MTITRNKASALISGRSNNQGALMAEKIEIRRHTIAGGRSVFIGEKLTIGKDISAEDAQSLVLMKKARVIESTKEKPQPKPEASEAVTVENRDNEVAKKTVKRSKPKKKKKK